MAQSLETPASYRPLLEAFLKEDLGNGDITTEAIVRDEQRATGRVVAKGPMLLAGLEPAVEVFRLLDPKLVAEIRKGDGSALVTGDEPAILRGKARALLTAERVALNLLQRLSGVATLTRQFVDAVEGTGAEILDTRKTTPGLRILEKYAVKVGGGRNHRLNLSEAILIKENHIRMAGGIRQAISFARKARAHRQILEVEVTTLDELQTALEESPDAILLDNMSPTMLRRAVDLARARQSKILLEASGGITLSNVRQYAEAGVDWISVGALTHSAPAADLSLEIEPVPER
jgi:nicotinate-nucleotide pyrophosphorylase (carboxylating)